MARAGVRALELYDPKAGKHLQAHMQARLGITNLFIQEGLAELLEFRDASGKLEDVQIKVGVFTEILTCVGGLTLSSAARSRKGSEGWSRGYWSSTCGPPSSEERC